MKNEKKYCNFVRHILNPIWSNVHFNHKVVVLVYPNVYICKIHSFPFSAQEWEWCKFRKGNWHWLLCSVLFVLKIPILNSKGPAQDRHRKTIYILNIGMKYLAKVLFLKKLIKSLFCSFIGDLFSSKPKKNIFIAICQQIRIHMYIQT